MTGLLQLGNQSSELTLAPPMGGAVVNFVHTDSARKPLLRGCDNGLSHILEAASFPLVPFVNRIRGGAFTFRGREVRLQPNMAGDKSPLHGQGWLSPWEVEASSDTCAELVFRHQPGEWPWAYEARQHFRLSGAGLELVLTCRNDSADPMPCGLGQHPYFLCGLHTRIDTQVGSAWTIDADVLPVAEVPATGRFDLTDRLVCAQDLDHGFGGWGGSARITDPASPFAIEMSSPDAGFFQLYSPASGGLFVAEPVTHANAALNAPEAEWPRLGMRVLQPGETMSLTMRIDIRET